MLEVKTEPTTTPHKPAKEKKKRKLSAGEDVIDSTPKRKRKPKEKNSNEASASAGSSLDFNNAPIKQERVSPEPELKKKNKKRNRHPSTDEGISSPVEGSLKKSRKKSKVKGER